MTIVVMPTCRSCTICKRQRYGKINAASCRICAKCDGTGATR